MTARNNRLKKVILETIAGKGPVDRDDVMEMIRTTCPPSILPSRRELANLLNRMPELTRHGKDPLQLYEYTGVGL